MSGPFIDVFEEISVDGLEMCGIEIAGRATPVLHADHSQGTPTVFLCPELRVGLQAEPVTEYVAAVWIIGRIRVGVTVPGHPMSAVQAERLVETLEIEIAPDISSNGCLQRRIMGIALPHLCRDGLIDHPAPAHALLGGNPQIGGHGAHDSSFAAACRALAT